MVVVLVSILIFPRRVDRAGFAEQEYFKHDLAAIDRDTARNNFSASPGLLRAGWGAAKITPRKPTPLAGFGERYGKMSQGVHDDVYAKAVAFSDGIDTAVLIGCDLLLVDHILATKIREEVSLRTPLKAGQLFFTASHTHSGPGGFAPGFMYERAAFGPFDPALPDCLADGFAQAITAAYRTMSPARVAHGVANAEDCIRNRARNAPVDAELSFMIVQKEDGTRCTITSFSAHPTVMGSRNLLLSADYPGYLQRYIEKETGGTCIYLGGAVGSMGNRVPEDALKALQASSTTPDDPFLRCQALGETLARRVLGSSANLDSGRELDVASIGIPIELPPPAWRVVGPLTLGLWGPEWGMNPLVMRALGVFGAGWMSAVRLGDMVLVNVPGDLSGEISVVWKQWAARQKLDLWAAGFSGEYAGYISPDKYFDEVYEKDRNGKLAYETGFMSLAGPHQEAFFTVLMQRMVRDLTPVTAYYRDCLPSLARQMRPTGPAGDDAMRLRVMQQVLPPGAPIQRGIRFGGLRSSRILNRYIAFSMRGVRV
jgi:hypothetical protein